MFLRTLSVALVAMVIPYMVTRNLEQLLVLIVVETSPFRSFHPQQVSDPPPIRVHADFNGLFEELLCLSHKETCIGADGRDVTVHDGMIVTAFDEDVDDDGKPDNLIAAGTVERSPKWLSCNGVPPHAGF